MEYVEPFTDSVRELFSTMLSAQATPRSIGVARVDVGPYDIVALIGLSGPFRGMVALAFPTSTALGMVNRLLDTEVRIVDDVVSDAVAEMANIVAGGAKAKLHVENDDPVQLSLPTTVRGNSFSVNYPLTSSWFEVCFDSEFGPFVMRVTVEHETQEGV